MGFSVLSHAVACSARFERIAGTALLCVDAAMLTVLLTLMCEPGAPPGPLLIGYPLIMVAGAMFFHVQRVVTVTIAAIASYLALLIAEHRLVQSVHYHVCFLIMLLAIAGCLVHQVRRMRRLGDYFESQR